MKKLIAIFLIALIASCNTQPKQEDGTSKMKEVIAIHDEVMPKMGTLARLARELNEKIQQEGPNDTYEAAVKDLGNAKTLMMDWMKAFGGEFSADEILKGAALSEEKQQALLEQEVAVKQVRAAILNSIAAAEALLAE